MKIIQKEIIKVYPVGTVYWKKEEIKEHLDRFIKCKNGLYEQKSIFADLFTKKDHLIATIVDLTNKENLEGDELKLPGECILYDDQGYPDIYINMPVTLDGIRYGLKLLSKQTGLKYKLIDEDYIELCEEEKLKEQQ